MAIKVIESFILYINNVKEIMEINTLANKVREDLCKMWEKVEEQGFYIGFDSSTLVDPNVGIMELEEFQYVFGNGVKAADMMENYVTNHIKYVVNSNFKLLDTFTYEVWVAFVVAYISWVTNVSENEILNSIYNYCNYDWRNGFSF